MRVSSRGNRRAYTARGIAVRRAPAVCRARTVRRAPAVCGARAVRGPRAVCGARGVCRARTLGAVMLTMFVMLATACASGGTRVGNGVTDGAESLRDDARLLAMFDTRARDTVLIDHMLQSADARRRARVALVIGQNTVRARYPVLRRLLVDADTGVAANAAYALGLAKDSASIVALGRAFAGAPDAVAREAAWALGEIGDAARAVLTIALGEGTSQPLTTSTAALRSPIVRGELVLAAVKMRAVPVAIVTAWALDTADVVVRAASYVVGRNRLPAGLRALLPLVSHRDEFVRQQVARAFVRTSTGDSLATRAREALATLLVDVSPRVRANAARSVGSFGPSARADLERALQDNDANVRVAASEVAGTVFARDAVAWRTAWERDSTYMVRRTLLVGARRGGSDALVSAETTWLASPEWRLRVAAIEARALGEGIDRVALARTAFADADGRVRASGIALLPSIADDTTVKTLVRGLLADSDVSVRAGASSMLARSASAADLEVVLDAYRRAAGDLDHDARAAALRFVAAVWMRDSSGVSSSARARLSALAPPPDPALRVIVERVSPLASWRNAARPAARPFSEYERIARRFVAPGGRLPVAVVRTERGDVTIELLAADAPLVVDAFIALAQRGYYRDTRFHRVVPNFVAQDGDPRGDGSGGPGFALRDAYTRQRHDRGCLGLATAGPDTGGSQYYLCHAAQPHLDGHYTVFGRVLSGFAALDAIVQGDRVISVEIR